jgi:hypothetical protein
MQQGVSRIPHGGSSTDRPPPVAQIFIPTPATTSKTVERSRQRAGSNKSRKSPKTSQQEYRPASMDRLVHQRGGHKQNTRREGMPSEEKRYPNDKHIPPEVLVQRPKTRFWRSFQSWAPSSVGHSKTSRSNYSHASKSSSRRVRYRTVRRISSAGTPSAPIKEDNPSPPRPAMRNKIALQPPCLLGSSENGSNTPPRMSGGPPAKAVDYKPSKPTGKIRVVWPPPPKAKGVKPIVEAVPARSELKKKGCQPRRSNDRSGVVVPNSKIRLKTWTGSRAPRPSGRDSRAK